MSKAGYPIRAVSRLTGLSIDTLRAWERRYEAIKPRRDGRGRTYSEEDIQRLKLLRDAVERGHSIGQIASLTSEDLFALATNMEILGARDQKALTVASAVVGQANLQPVLEAIERFNYVDVDRELNRLAAILSTRELIYQVVIPLMKEVGDRWYTGSFNIAQEHMVSSILRNLLGALVRLYSQNEPKIGLLFATPSGELHEFGVLAAAMLAAGSGLRVIYLGASLPAGEIAKAASRTSAKAVILGIKRGDANKNLIAELRQTYELLPKDTELWVGGNMSDELLSQLKQTDVIYLEDFHSLELQIARLKAQF